MDQRDQERIDGYFLAATTSRSSRILSSQTQVRLFSLMVPASPTRCPAPCFPFGVSDSRRQPRAYLLASEAPGAGLLVAGRGWAAGVAGGSLAASSAGPSSPGSACGLWPSGHLFRAPRLRV